MAETVTTTIRGVFDPEGNKPYNITTTGEPARLSTFKAPIGEEAKKYRGQLVKLTYSTSPFSYVRRDTGETVTGTNYLLESVEPAQSLDETRDQELAEIGLAVQSGQAVPANNGSSYGGKSAEDRAEIRRSVALKAAAELAPWLKVFANEETRTTVNVLRVAQQLEEYVEKGEDIFGAPAS